MPNTTGTIRIDKLPKMNVTVKLSRGAGLRLELSILLVRLATWVLGNESRVTVERDE